jgi:hypothetical protein
MSEPKDLPENSIRLTAILEGDTMRLSTGYHFAEDFDQDQVNYFCAILDGLTIAMEVEPERFLTLAKAGYVYQEICAAMKEQDEEEYLDSIPDAENLIKMKPKGGRH